jgi:hypothetical protein
MSELPLADSADTDAVQMALQAAHTLWSRGDTTESLRWLKRAAESASDEGADLRSLQLAKAAAELRAKLFPTASDAPPAPARVPTQRDLSGIRPTAEALAREAEVATVSGGARAASAGDIESRSRSEESPPSSRSPSSAPQYVVHRPREAQRQLMGLSSSTLETARQHNGASYASVPSWSAGSERRASSPPPLPARSLDDYEELDAEPVEEESDAHARAWAATAAPTWRPADRQAAARDAGLDAMQREERQREERRREDSSPRIATLPPPSFQPSLSSSPPPLPQLSAFEDEADAMRSEQPTQVIPPREERTGDAEQMLAAMSVANVGGETPRPLGSRGEPMWDADPRMPSGWDPGSYGWAGEQRGSAAAAAEQATAPAEAAPPKLTARVHHQAVRVSFAPDSRAPGQYVVRPLREGERPPAGERVALLVALEPGVPLV